MTVPYFEQEHGARPRIIVALTMENGRLVRTRQFRQPIYVGDPINAVKIFSDKGADELVLLEIGGRGFGPEETRQIREIASEAFMPISFGGGIRSLQEVRQLFQLGYEKVVLNTALHENPALAAEAAAEFGSQAVVASMEVARTRWQGPRVFYGSAKKKTSHQPRDWARRCEDAGCGELIVNSIDRDGSMQGYDLELLKEVAQAVSIPVIALGGAGSGSHFREGLVAGASAVAAGSMFVFHGPRRAVLITYPQNLLVQEQPSSPV
jgi:cyclase